jgi:hypothetical protein
MVGVDHRRQDEASYDGFGPQDWLAGVRCAEEQSAGRRRMRIVENIPPTPPKPPRTFDLMDVSVEEVRELGARWADIAPSLVTLGAVSAPSP